MKDKYLTTSYVTATGQTQRAFIPATKILTIDTTSAGQVTIKYGAGEDVGTASIAILTFSNSGELVASIQRQVLEFLTSPYTDTVRELELGSLSIAAIA